MTSQQIVCAECGKPSVVAGFNVKYCRPCSAAKSEARVAASRAKRGVGTRPSTWGTGQQERRKSAAARSLRRGSAWMAEEPPELAWKVMVQVPFTWAFSKNHIYSLNRRGHVHLRDEHVEARDNLTSTLREAMARHGVKVVTNKIWLDILVEKASHRGDAVNVIDGVCDAVKKAVDLDDRWYSIRRLDWEVVPVGGQIYVGLGQEDVPDAQVCSLCGRVLPLDSFTRNRSTTNGRSRTCRECGTSRASAALVGPGV